MPPTPADYQKSEYDADLEIHKETLKAFLAVAQKSLDRAQTTADFVQKIAVALAAAYTTVLGLMFSIKDNPLPTRGFIPTIFFAVSAGLAAAYLAFLTRPEATRTTLPSNLPRVNSLRKVVTFINWTNRAVHRRAHFLRGAVVALLFGIAFLPVALVQSPTAAASAAPTSSASPTASPAWPTPPASPTAAELELYKAQLQAHAAAVGSSAEETADVASPSQDGGIDALAWVAALIAGVVVAGVALNWIPRDEPPDGSASGSIPGTTLNAQ